MSFLLSEVSLTLQDWQMHDANTSNNMRGRSSEQDSNPRIQPPLECSIILDDGNISSDESQKAAIATLSSHNPTATIAFQHNHQCVKLVFYARSMHPTTPIGSISFTADSFLGHRYIKRWVTLFDPEDDSYDGNFLSDDLECPRVLLSFQFEDMHGFTGSAIESQRDDVSNSAAMWNELVESAAPEDLDQLKKELEDDLMKIQKAAVDFSADKDAFQKSHQQSINKSPLPQSNQATQQTERQQIQQSNASPLPSKLPPTPITPTQIHHKDIREEEFFRLQKDFFALKTVLATRDSTLKTYEQKLRSYKQREEQFYLQLETLNIIIDDLKHQNTELKSAKDSSFTSTHNNNNINLENFTPTFQSSSQFLAHSKLLLQPLQSQSLHKINESSQIDWTSRCKDLEFRLKVAEDKVKAITQNTTNAISTSQNNNNNKPTHSSNSLEKRALENTNYSNQHSISTTKMIEQIRANYTMQLKSANEKLIESNETITRISKDLQSQKLEFTKKLQKLTDQHSRDSLDFSQKQDHANETIEKLASRIEELLSESHAAIIERDEWKSQATHARNRCDDFKAQLAVLQLRTCELTAEFTDERSSLHDRIRELEIQQQQHIKTTTNIASTACADVLETDWQERIDEYDSRIIDITNINEALTQELRKLQHEVETQSKESSSLKQTIAHLNSQLLESTQHSQAIEIIQSQLHLTTNPEEHEQLNHHHPQQLNRSQITQQTIDKVRLLIEERNELEDKIEQLTQNMQQLQNEILILSNELKSTSAKNEDNSHQIEQLNEQLKQSESQLNNCRSQAHSEAIAANEAKQALIRSLEQQSDSLKQSLLLTESRLASRESEFNRILLESQQSIEQQLHQKHQAQLDELTSQSTQIQQNLQHQIQLLQHQYTQIQEETQIKLSNSIHEQEQNTTQMILQKQYLHETMQTLSNLREQLTESESQAAHLTEINISIEEQLKQLKHSNQTTLESLKAEHESNAITFTRIQCEFESQITHLNSKISDQFIEIQECSAQRIILQESHQKRQLEFEGIIESLKQEITNLENRFSEEKSHLLNIIHDLEIAVEKITAQNDLLATELAQSNEIITQQQLDSEHQSAQSDSNNQIIAARESEINILKESNAALEVQLTILTAKHAESLDRFNEINNQNIDLLNSNQEIADKLEKTTTQLEEITKLLELQQSSSTQVITHENNASSRVVTPPTTTTTHQLDQSNNNNNYDDDDLKLLNSHNADETTPINNANTPSEFQQQQQQSEREMLEKMVSGLIAENEMLRDTLARNLEELQLKNELIQYQQQQQHQTEDMIKFPNSYNSESLAKHTHAISSIDGMNSHNLFDSAPTTIAQLPSSGHPQTTQPALSLSQILHEYSSQPPHSLQFDRILRHNFELIQLNELLTQQLEAYKQFQSEPEINNSSQSPRNHSQLSHSNLFKSVQRHADNSVNNETTQVEEHHNHCQENTQEKRRITSALEIINSSNAAVDSISQRERSAASKTNYYNSSINDCEMQSISSNSMDLSLYEQFYSRGFTHESNSNNNKNSLQSRLHARFISLQREHTTQQEVDPFLHLGFTSNTDTLLKYSALTQLAGTTQAERIPSMNSFLPPTPSSTTSSGCFKSNKLSQKKFSLAQNSLSQLKAITHKDSQSLE